ncbi:MAG: hypothetical protein PHG97_04875 [Candidatus Margulisbacteria bacterium]|nr:hypothetical protein [Candidatus Margulisiibacteriota bacterium]
MVVNIYNNGQLSGYYSDNQCVASEDDPVPATNKPAASPDRAQPVQHKPNVRAEIVSGLFGVFMGCSGAADNCRDVSELLGSCDRLNIPFDFTGQDPPEKIAYMSNLTSEALAMIPACFLNGVIKIEFVPVLDRLARASINMQNKTTTVFIRSGTIEVEPQPQFTAPFWVEQVIHEIAHHVQQTTCDDRGFNQISWDGKATTFDDFVSGYASSAKIEDFPESFAMYIYNPGQFRWLAARSAQVQAKYELLKREYFGGQEFSRPWDRLDAGAMHFQHSELAEALIAYNDFDLEHGGEPGAAEALEIRLTGDLTYRYISQTLVQQPREKKIEELRNLIAAYANVYPKLTVIVQKTIDRLTNT